MGSKASPSSLISGLPQNIKFEVQLAVGKIIDQLAAEGMSQVEAAVAVADAADDYLMRLTVPKPHIGDTDTGT